MKDEFYLTSPHNWVGRNVAFWGKNGNGYTSNLDEAEIYTREKMQKKVSDGHLRHYPNEEMPLSASHVNELSEWRVDCQYVNKEYPEHKDANGEYVAYRKGCWDGNDLGFASILSHSFNYESARTFTEEQISVIDFDGWVVVPKSHTDEIARRAFQGFNINKRKMVQGAGIKGCRKPRESKTTGKVRWNCPCCGKISWQWNPYEFEGCNDINCEEWTSNLDRFHP